MSFRWKPLVALALQFLSRALEAGYVHGDSPLGFADDPHLSSLHGNPEFEALIAKTRTTPAQ